VSGIRPLRPDRLVYIYSPAAGVAGPEAQQVPGAAGQSAIPSRARGKYVCAAGEGTWFRTSDSRQAPPALAHQAHAFGSHSEAGRQKEQVTDQVALDRCSGDIGNAESIGVSTQVVGVRRRYPDLEIAGGSTGQPGVEAVAAELGLSGTKTKQAQLAGKEGRRPRYDISQICVISWSQPCNAPPFT
jgi:hypothetical protein